MKNNILIRIILLLIIGFLSYCLRQSNKTIKEQKTQINILNQQNLDFQKDLIKYNEEIINNKKEINEFKIKTKELSKNKSSSNCLNQPLDADILQLLKDSGMSK